VQGQAARASRLPTWHGTFITAVAVPILAPAGIVAPFVAPFIAIPLLVPTLAPAAFSVAAALLVDRPVSLLLPGIRPLARRHLLLEHATDIADVLCHCRPSQRTHSDC
jgi:hypothetical protein